MKTSAIIVLPFLSILATLASAKLPSFADKRVSPGNCQFTHAMREAFDTGRLYCKPSFQTPVSSYKIDFREQSPPGTVCRFECHNETALPPVRCQINGQWSRSDALVTKDFLTCTRAVSGISQLLRVLEARLPVLNKTQLDRVASFKRKDSVVPVMPPPPPPPAIIRDRIPFARQDHDSRHLFLGKVLDLGNFAVNTSRHFRLLLFPHPITYSQSWIQCSLFDGKLAWLDTHRTYGMFKLTFEDMERRFSALNQASTCRAHPDKLAWLGGKSFGRRNIDWRWVNDPQDKFEDGIPMKKEWRTFSKYVTRGDKNEEAVGIRLQSETAEYMKLFDWDYEKTTCYALCESLDAQ